MNDIMEDDFEELPDSPLTIACSEGNLEKVQELLLEEAYHPNYVLNEALVKALQCKKESSAEIVCSLLQHGADLDYKLAIPLRTAILSGNVKGVEILIAAGAKLNLDTDAQFEIQDVYDGDDPYHVQVMEAACTSRPNIHHRGIGVLKEMTLEAVKEKMKIMRMLLEAGLSMNYYEFSSPEEPSTMSALHTVCGDNYRTNSERMPVEMAELLLLYGAEMDNADEESGVTALHVACRNLDFQKIKLLVNYGANVEKPNIYGFTPIQCCTLATREHCLDDITDDIVKFLVEEKGADIEVVCPETKFSLLSLACETYEESKLAIVLYFMSQVLPLQSVAALFLIKNFGLAGREYTSDDGWYFMPYHGKQIISILLIDNALRISRSDIQSCLKAMNGKKMYMYNTGTMFRRRLFPFELGDRKEEVVKHLMIQEMQGEYP